MMEHTTDRLFWTLSSIIIAALLLTLGVKIFPKATSEAIHPMSGVVQSADKSTSAVDQAISGANADKLDWQTGTNGGVGNVSSGSDDTARDQAINNQITKQNQALQSYQGQLNDAVNHINDLNSRLVSLQNDKTGANNTKDINDLKSQINDANGQIKNYQSQISSLNDQITQLKNSQQSSDGNNSANSAAIQQLQQQQQNLQNDNDGNTGLIQQLKQQIQGLNTKTSNLDSYQNQLTNASAQIQNLIAQMGKLQASGGDNSTAIADTKNQIAQLAQQINSTNTQMQQQIATLQSHDIYNITSINDSTNLSTLTTPGTYIYTAGGAGKGISKLAGADNMADVLTNTRPWAWDDGYASIVVSPQLGTWQTQTLIGANGITMVRTMNNGQNFDTNIDSRDKWHLISGDNTNSVMYKGDVTSTDLNNITETGIYSTQGAPGPNSPSQDWTGTLTVLNNTKGMITQNFTTQDGGAPNNEQSWQRIYAYGSWTQWQRTDGGMQPQILSGSNSLLDPGNNNWADGVYKVNGVSRDTPWNIANRYGILVKHTTYSDVSLTYYDAWWNGIYVNYKTISGWQGWREATN